MAKKADGKTKSGTAITDELVQELELAAKAEAEQLQEAHVAARDHETEREAYRATLSRFPAPGGRRVAAVGRPDFSRETVPLYALHTGDRTATDADDRPARNGGSPLVSSRGPGALSFVQTMQAMQARKRVDEGC